MEATGNVVTAQRAFLRVLEELLEDAEFAEGMTALKGDGLDELLKTYTATKVRREKLFNECTLDLLE